MMPILGTLAGRFSVRLEAVGKRYGLRQPWVVRGVSADLRAGRLIRVSGRNGSGKSTLLRVVAGVSLPTAGKVTGRPHTGYMPERFPGGLPFSGREYLLHLARVHGLRGALGRRRVEEWLERLGATGYADQSLRSMSKGMCQKMAIAQALLPSPGLLVLDEAWTGLDQAAREELDAAVTERVAAGGMVLFVDHDPARLAGREDERWNFDGAGGVTVLAGPAPQAAPRVESVILRLETTDAASVVDRVRALDGVRVISVDLEGAGGS
jgi:ABC-type multidrug transport system ATPase subunit